MAWRILRKAAWCAALLSATAGLVVLGARPAWWPALAADRPQGALDWVEGISWGVTILCTPLSLILGLLALRHRKETPGREEPSDALRLRRELDRLPRLGGRGGTGSALRVHRAISDGSSPGRLASAASTVAGRRRPPSWWVRAGAAAVRAARSSADCLGRRGSIGCGGTTLCTSAEKAGTCWNTWYGL